MTDQQDLYDYSHGTNVLAEAGGVQAFGDRILCRAILEHDSYKGDLQLVTYNTYDALAFEIVSIGGGVAGKLSEMNEAELCVGDHIDIKSVAADR